MVAVEHMQRAACCLGLPLQPLQQEQQLDLLITAVKDVTNLEEKMRGTQDKI
jgi:hypothetical protein